MPHTSHKKKPLRNKRKEIQGEDGWTRVTSGSASPATQHPAAQAQALYDEEMQGFEPYTLKGVEEGDKVICFPITPRKADEKMSDAKLVDQYRKIEKSWTNSVACNSLRDTLRSRAMTPESTIKTCVCFGTGSFSGLRDNWIGRHEVALYQIAAFKTVVDTIEQITGKRPPAFAQEPDYNEFDTKLLSTLSITKVNHPAGFCLLTPQSFAFCPGAELFVNLRTLYYNPAIYMGAHLDLYREKDGRMYSSLVSYSLPVEVDGKEGDISLDEVEKIDMLQNRETIRENKEERFQSSRTIEAYARDKANAKLPNLDAKDYPFHEVHLYWAPPESRHPAHAIPAAQTSFFMP